MLLPRYMYISSNDKVVRAKKGTGGLHLVKTVKTWSPSSFPSSPPLSSQPPSPWTPIQVQAIIIASYAEPVTAEQCAVVTEKLGDYLVSVGYWTFLLHIFANFWCSAIGPFSQICWKGIHWPYLISISSRFDHSEINLNGINLYCLNKKYFPGVI